MKRSSVVLVFNDQKELALQLRGANDKSYPSHWDFSAAGGIDEGEDPVLAAERELKEEIGINKKLSFVAEVLYSGVADDDYLYIYKTTHNESFNPDGVEVDDVQFFSLEQIEKMIDFNEKFHPEFVFLWERGFFKQIEL